MADPDVLRRKVSPAELAARLAPSAGERNILIGEYEPFELRDRFDCGAAEVGARCGGPIDVASQRQEGLLGLSGGHLLGQPEQDDEPLQPIHCPARSRFPARRQWTAGLLVAGPLSSAEFPQELLDVLLLAAQLRLDRVRVGPAEGTRAGFGRDVGGRTGGLGRHRTRGNGGFPFGAGSG